MPKVTSNKSLTNIMPDDDDPRFCFRFRKPERVSPWEGVLDGTKMPNTCVQVKFLGLCELVEQHFAGKQHSVLILQKNSMLLGKIVSKYYRKNCEQILQEK